MKLDPKEIAALMRSDFATFIHRVFVELFPHTDFLESQHILLIASHLEAVRLGHIRRLIINMPPRHLKSICVSVAFPAWCMGHDPGLQIIVACYGQELSEKFGRDTRKIMLSRFYLDLVMTRLSVRQAAHDFSTTMQGGRMATSVGGPLNGRGGQILIVDDPLKPDEAMSETRRAAANEWFDHTFMSRLNNKETGAIIVTMQRLHQDDVVGHVLEQGGWTVLDLPAIAQEDEVYPIDSALLGRRWFRRKAGEPLHAARESLETLRTIRETIGEYAFQSQYLQRPIPKGGAMVRTEWLRYYDPGDLPARFSRIVQSWDTANKATELSDYSVCTTWGVHERRFYLLDVVRKRMEFPELQRRVRQEAARWPSPTILIEDKASGTQLIQNLRAEFFQGVSEYKPPPGSDKTMRLHIQTPAFEGGLVLLPRQAHWLADYVTEITSFPGSRHDDQVDSTSQALDHMRVPSKLETWAKLAEM